MPLALGVRSSLLLGCDFSSSPTRRKQIVIAVGAQDRGRVVLHSLERVDSLESFSDWLSVPRGWIGGFDLPFGLPRPLVASLSWPQTWESCIRHYAGLSRTQIRDTFAAFCAARPVGGKFAHRATDGPAGSSSSMKWVNPPVAFMLHAGVPRLLGAGIHFPGHQPSVLPQAALRVALEAYPGLLAREVLGARSYKNDVKAKQTPERLIARKDLVTALEMGRTRLGVSLKVSHAQRDALVEDATGDALDAVLCLLQAAWAERQSQAGHPCYGLPANVDPLEGWILTA